LKVIKFLQYIHLFDSLSKINSGNKRKLSESAALSLQDACSGLKVDKKAKTGQIERISSMRLADIQDFDASLKFPIRKYKEYESL